MNYTYKLLIAYEGTAYGGWQVQSNALTIQPLIEKALTTFLRYPVHIVGAGRTDAGVHALGQVAHFCLPHPVEKRRLLYAANALLPPDIRLLDLEEVEEGFHARYSALSKTYHYHLHLDRVRDPFTRRYTTPVLHKVDLNLMQKALPFFLGTHDFTAFAHEAHKGSAAKNGVRTLTRLDLFDEPGGIRLEFEGNGFLYKMVRNITGTLLAISALKIPLEILPALFAAKDRRKTGKTAPPQGLFLVKVTYPNRKNPLESFLATQNDTPGEK